MITHARATRTTPRDVGKCISICRRFTAFFFYPAYFFFFNFFLLCSLFYKKKKNKMDIFFTVWPVFTLWICNLNNTSNDTTYIYMPMVRIYFSCVKACNLYSKHARKYNGRIFSAIFLQHVPPVNPCSTQLIRFNTVNALKILSNLFYSK